MKVTFWTKAGLAYIWAEAVLKEYRKSIRFLMPDNTAFTIRKNDIVSIEKED